MKISDRLLRHYLDHVYWICGGPCGGKSSMAEAVASKWGMKFYSVDEQTFEYQKKANPQDHPAILRHFVDWEWYFLGRGNSVGQWLNSVFEESVEFTILDLLQLGKDKPIVVDGFMDPEFLKVISDSRRIIYLFAEESVIRSGHFDRDHVSGMEDLFQTLSDPSLARSKSLESIVKGSQHYYQQVQKQDNLKCFIRDASTQKEDMLMHIEKHFGLS